MASIACIVCKRAEVRLFHVGSNYGEINHTVGDDLIDIYGDQVRLFVSPDSCVCNVCMNMLDTMSKLKQSIWSVIKDPCSKPSRLYKFYKLFASLKLEEDNIEDVQLQDATNRTPTPKLLTHAYSVPYNENLEVQLAERERLRSLSRSSSYFARSTSDTSEVQNILSKRKRRKIGHNWTRRKGSKSRTATSRSRSLVSRHGKNSMSQYQSSSPCSDYSYANTYVRVSSRATVQSSSTVKKEKLSTTWTRSVSRAHEEENRSNSSILHCTVDECGCGYDDIVEMNLHNINEHQMLPRHYCQECRDVFTSLELLKLHMEYHDSSSFYCLMCGVEQNNSRELQQHLDEHMLYSVPCKFCDRSFLNHDLRKNHVTKCHKGRRRRRSFNRKLILDRIDKSEDEKDDYFVEEGYRASVTAVFYTESSSAEPLTSVTDGPETSGAEGDKPALPRSHSERLLAINKDFFNQEKELREKYHDIIYSVAEKVMKTSQTNQIKTLKDQFEKDTTELMRKLQADHREEVKALAKKHRNREQFTRVKREAVTAVVGRGVSEREKLGQLFENRKDELQKQHEQVKDLLVEHKDKAKAALCKEFEMRLANVEGE